MNNTYSLRQLGWQPYFQQQLTLAELESCHIARIIEQHRNQYILQSEQGLIDLPVTSSLPKLTVGDWLLLNQDHHFDRALDAKSVFKRKAAGSKVDEQLIAANVDTLFIVCSLNHDFNLNRIERYLALASEAMVEPVVVLTKVDLCIDADDKKRQVQQLDLMLMVELVNSLESDSVKALAPWCGVGKTVSFLGSSGVGKSTLVNTLLGEQNQATGDIRQDDSKGRHTTRARSMRFIKGGAAVIDTPGMRELQLTDCEQGVSQTFNDVESLIQRCRFSDCSHTNEPGCAILQAIENNELELRRYQNYQKLMREQARNSASLKQKRDKEKALSKMYRTVLADSVAMKKGY